MAHLRRPQYKTKNTSRKRGGARRKNHRTMDCAEKEVMYLRKKQTTKHCSNGIKNI